MENPSADIKFKSRECGNVNVFSVISFDIMNFVIAIPLKNRGTEVISKALIHTIICIFAYQN